jgi:hypothetical protein
VSKKDEEEGRGKAEGGRKIDFLGSAANGGRKNSKELSCRIFLEVLSPLPAS